MISSRQTSLPKQTATVVAALLTAVPASALEPFQTVRSMQLVQDRIADGDHAAMPMQSRVLALADQSMRDADPKLFEDQRNFEALLVYGMSGGNPVTLDVVLARLKLTDEQKIAGTAVSQYLRGNVGGAAASLNSIHIENMPAGARAFMSLVKGSLIAKGQPAQALQLFDFARLEAPGTLVEEAALRRSLPAAVELKDGRKFLRLASQYARRFLRSPYATQFADELVSGIIALNGTMENAQVEEVIGEMTPAHQKVVYLRLARTSAIDGQRALSDFAASKVAAFGGEPGVSSAARAQLYANLTSVASDNAEGVLDTLRKIDRDELNAADRQLLDAAISVASVVTSPTPAPEIAPIDAQPVEKPAKPAAAGSDASETVDAQNAPAVEAPPASLPVAADAKPHEPQPLNSNVDDSQQDEPLAVLTDAKRKLDEIDKILADDQ